MKIVLEPTARLTGSLGASVGTIKPPMRTVDCVTSTSGVIWIASASLGTVREYEVTPKLKAGRNRALAGEQADEIGVR